MLEVRVAAQLVAGAAIVGKDDGVWQEIARAAGELFGYSTALLEKVVVVGAPHADAHGTDLGGAVYVFDRATGGLLARLTEPRPSSGADFGVAVGGVHDEIVVGAQKGRSPNGRGAAYAFPADQLAGTR